jgi:uncharacterized protein with von Willebrand factor type A (vWA) domain
MGRVYGIASRALAGHAPLQIYNKHSGLTRYVPSLFPTEKAKLHPSVHPAVRAKAVEEFVVNGLQGIKQTAEAKREGAFIFAKDGSGSMDGKDDGKTDRHTIASALCLGLAKAAKSNGQLWRGFMFGSGNELSKVVSNTSAFQDLLEWSTHAFRGGTDFDNALRFALDIFDGLDSDDRASADILMVTDGEAGIASDTVERVKQYRDEFGMRLWVLLVGRAAYGDIIELADKVLVMNDFDAIAKTMADLIFLEVN